MAYSGGQYRISKMTNSEHLKDNIDIFDFELTEEEMKSIRALDKNKRYYTLNLQQQEAQLSQWKPAD